MRRWLVLACLLVAGPAGGLAIVSGDGAGNTTPPADDPGWAHVGRRAEGNVLPVVYLGAGWVLTAGHVGAGDVVLGGATYSWVPGSAQVLTNADGSRSDLVLFRLSTRPRLARLPVSGRPPAQGERVVLIGFGQQRTAPATWQGHRGFSLGTSGYMRWGTNVVEQTNVMLAGAGARTHGFTTSFSETDGTPDEAQAAPGDSGSAVFARKGTAWELAGLAHAVQGVAGQPPNLVLFGASTLISDLSYYKAQIDALVGEPAR